MFGCFQCLLLYAVMYIHIDIYGRNFLVSSVIIHSNIHGSKTFDLPDIHNTTLFFIYMCKIYILVEILTSYNSSFPIIFHYEL